MASTPAAARADPRIPLSERSNRKCYTVWQLPLRVAIDGCASPRLRVALEAIDEAAADEVEVGESLQRLTKAP